MKENKYDDDQFFKAYGSMSRSVHGLGAAGEWPVLKALLPDFNGKRVLDIGCGYGWHCNYAVEQGAFYALGVDISEKMLAIAREKSTSPNIEYLQVAMEDMDFDANSFDIVISSLALHYTLDFERVCRCVYKALTSGGSFVFSVEHPIFTAQGLQDWVYDSGGNISHWPVDQYFVQGRRDTVFLGENVVKYHRTLTAYVQALVGAGFSLMNIIEPAPNDEVLANEPDMRDELRRPMMLLFAVRKL